MLTHTLVLEGTNGRKIASIKEVPSLNIVDAFTRLQEAGRFCACPIIFVDGTGYTSRREFMERINTVNQYSLDCGGARIYG